MENKVRILPLLLCIFVGISLAVEQASFYGSSYIAIPFEEAKTTTDIYFKFRTRLPDTLILLIAGTTDYCKVDLENGRLRLVVNLGSGEAELISPAGVKLNDFKWHEITIIRRDANLSMIIDKTRKIQKRIPGKHFELNIHYGLFVGDHRNKNNSDLFFGHIKTYRGCLSGLRYNDVKVLDEARHRQLNSIVEGITWNCAAEFEATLDQAVSFVEDDAYMIIPQKTRYKELSIKFDVKSTTKDGLLFYNAGFMKQDFLLIEISNYSLRATVKIGEKFLKLHVDDTVVSDGIWNKVTFSLSPTTVDIGVNENVKFAKNIYASLYQLNDISYVGGLEVSKRFRATQKGCLKSCDTNFKGCIKNLVVLDQKKGLPDAVVTEGLLPGCMWQYPCLQTPCKDNSVCVQQGLDSFQCQCKEQLCVKQNYTEGYKVFSKSSSLATELELLSVEPLEVLEGSSEIITTNNLHIVLDYKKYGIKDSGINFFMISGPEHGAINVDVWPYKQSFSLLDIARDKVHYIHDGSENKRDSMVLAVEFSTEDTFTLPVYLQGKFRFNLAVTVVPKNDVPVFDISETKVLRIVQGAKKVITSDLFKAEDSDNSPHELIYSVKADHGYFEHIKKPGEKITSFLQEDVNKRKIIYVYESTYLNDSYISLEVSDGIEVSATYKLRVSPTPQVWRLEKNTGLQLLHQTSSVITPYNLSFTSNVPNSDYKILFKVVKKPNFGSIEVERSVNSWEATDVFSSTDLKQHRVRYKHLKAQPEYDEFQFRTALNKSLLYTFRVTFVECTLYQAKTNILELNGVWESAISIKSLSFETRPFKPLTSIKYQILTYTKYGYLFSSVSKYRIRCYDNFTQEDVISENIRYRLYHKAFSDVTDVFFVSVESPGCNNITANVTIKYHPSQDDKAKVKAKINELQVEEGGSTIIDTSHLHLEVDFVSDFVYNITSPPQHGVIQTVKDSSVRNTTNAFTTEEIRNNQVFYLHDGSETTSDSFKFMALSSKDDTFQYVDDVTIKIHLKNDHSPTRVIDRVFQIVVGGEKLLTGKDLKYVDLDVGTPTSGIVYTLREIPNGYFFNVKDKTKNVTEFSQEDLDDNLILFKHKGPEYGKVRLWVTDGQFHVTDILEIQASGPFIHVTIDKKIVVEVGKITVITSEHLSYATNLFTTDKNVLYEVVNGPTFGKIVNSKNLKTLKNFTQENINAGQVSYLNDVSSGSADEIGIKIHCKDAVNVAQIGVLILPSSYWEPLQLKHLKKLFVEESTSTILTRDNLEVHQVNVPSSVITYHINDRPQYGYLTVLSDTKNGSEVVNVISFTQDLINENRVLYIQSGMNQSRDIITFNITNGLVWLKNVQLNIVIIPEKWYLGTNDITVNEGGTATLNPTHIFIQTDYYKLKSTTFTIKENSKHGCIQVYKQCAQSKSFTSNELAQDFVQYAHDGTENSEDFVTLVAEIEGKKSEAIRLKIIVVPVNDHWPKIVNNTGLVMWEGGVSIITNKMLAATDEDRPKETLKYHVQSCWWGNVSVVSDTKTSLNYFTQEFLDKGMVVFKHHSGPKAWFKFNVSDGLHTTKNYLFEIKTNPVRMKLISKQLHIFPLQKKYITPDILFTENSDGRSITYEITIPPTLGRLMMQSEKGYDRVVASFTQDDLNNSRIYYEHLHPFLDLYANDSFTFNVKSYLTPTINDEVLKIDISVYSGGLDKYIHIPKITVDEGGAIGIPINLSEVVSFLEMHSGLHSPVIHASSLIQPAHGRIFLQNSKDSKLTTFTQKQLESGQVYYEHDNSDTLRDTVYFSLYLIPGYIVLCNFSVPVIVNPVNDQPFKLITVAPNFVVVQGENHTITRDELCTVDADTGPDKIKYDLVNGPSSGRLLLLPDLVPINYFTQSDIDEKRLIYMHNGLVLKDSFHLRIWDEKFKPEFTFFNIIVLPINITITTGLPIYVKQGSDVGYLKHDTFIVETNADQNKIRYTVTEKPKHGVLFKDNNKITTFTQEDLFKNHVMYLQLDMSASEDTFRVTGEILVGNATFGREVYVRVQVTPLMHVQDVYLKSGNVTKISMSQLNATALADLTGLNPEYVVVTLPSFCQVRKIIRSSGQKINILNSVVKVFTHKDIQGGLIYLEMKKPDGIPREGLHGTMVFLLAAGIYQPARGEMKIHVNPLVDDENLLNLPDPSDPEGHEGEVLLTTPNITRDYILIVTIILAIVITTIVIIIIMKCRSLDSEGSNKEEVALQPLPLPRPPERLMSSSPSPLKSHLDVSFTPPMSLALPQCKVTPLSRSEFETPSPHVGYPYGVEDMPDDWSSIDNASDQASKSIMLRRNQYWV